MKDLQIITKYKECGIKELPTAEQELTVAAMEACDKSFAPFSGLNVGAAALLADGKVMTAGNQESEVFPSGMCAERVLLYAVKSSGHNEIGAIAITAKYEGTPVAKYTFPCGGCIQALVDMEKRQRGKIKLIIKGGDSCVVLDSVSLLMPFKFSFSK